MALTSAQRMAALDELQKTRSQAANVYEQYVGSGGTVNLLAQQALQKKMGQSPFVEEAARLREQQQLTPTTYAKELREGRFAGDPTLAAAAAAQREAGIQRRLGTIQGYQQEREGSVKDIAGAITAGYQAQTDKARANLDRIDQEFSQQLSMAQFAAQEEERKRKEKETSPVTLANGQIAMVDRYGRIVRTIGSPKATGTGGGSTTEFKPSQSQLNEALKIMKSPDILSNEAKAGRGADDKAIAAAAEDNYISNVEAQNAFSRILPLVNNDNQRAYQLMKSAMQYGGMQLWDDLSDDEKNKILGNT